MFLNCTTAVTVMVVLIVDHQGAVLVRTLHSVRLSLSTEKFPKRVKKPSRFPFCCTWLKASSSCSNTTSLPGMDAAHLCITHPGHWHPVNTQSGVYPFQGLLIHKLAHTSLPSDHPDRTLMPTNMQQQQQQQHYYHNRWQETAAASASSKWAFGFVYLLSTLSCEH